MDFRETTWWGFLDEGQKDLVMQSWQLLEMAGGGKQFHDYSYVVFPMAKAYEGFLKKWFYSLGLIDKATYEGHKFRLGKALNPDLPEKYRSDWWMFGPLEERYGEKLPQQLWLAWKECRNLLFHFFPQHTHFIAIADAKERLEQLSAAMAVTIQPE